MNTDIQAYNQALSGEEKNICDILSSEIDKHLAKS